MRWAAFGLLALASCSALTTFDGLVGQGSLDGGSSQNPDGSSDGGKTATDGGAIDAADIDAASCDLSQPFGVPVAVPGLSDDQGASSARFTADELTVYFESYRSGSVGGNDIWVATRASRSDGFGTAVNLTAINTQYDDYDPAISEDDLTLLVSQAGSGGVNHIVQWTRASVNDPFGNPITLTAFDVAGDNLYQPYFGALDTTICFNVNDESLACAPRFEDGGVGAPSTLAQIPGGAAFPTLSADALSLYYSGGGVFLSQRTALNQGFPSGTQNATLSTGEDEAPDWLSIDGCRLYVEQYVDDAGAREVFVSTRGQ